MVYREQHPINRGKRPEHCAGLPNKLYNKYDIIRPIVDSMTMMYYSLGWAAGPAFQDDEEYLYSTKHLSRSSSSSLDEFVYGASTVSKKPPLCVGCLTTNPADFMPTADKSHLVCKCGVVSSAIHVSNHREKNCAEDEDKTTHADKPYEPKTDRFDHPAKSCEELRKEREREASGTRISRKTREKLGIGWQQEHAAREAAKAERQRKEMSAKDQTKGNHIQLELDKLFTPLEPLAAPIKRFIRMETDRAWREAVRHNKICQAKSMCQLRVKEKGPTVIADAALACSLNILLEGDVTLEGVTHAGLLVIADKLGALQNAKGSSCALRAVRTIVGTLLRHHQSDPIESCPMLACQSSPAPSTSSDQSVRPSVGSTPFVRNDSSVSDVSEGGEIIQLRDSISKVFKALNDFMPNRIRDGALRAIQDVEFRSFLSEERAKSSNIAQLPYEGLSYAILEAVARQAEASGGGSCPRKVPPRLLAWFGGNSGCLNAAISDLSHMLPEGLAVDQDLERDGLFG